MSLQRKLFRPVSHPDAFYEDFKIYNNPSDPSKGWRFDDAEWERHWKNSDANYFDTLEQERKTHDRSQMLYAFGLMCSLSKLIGQEHDILPHFARSYRGNPLVSDVVHELDEQVRLKKWQNETIYKMVESN